MSKLLSRANACFQAGTWLWNFRHNDDGFVDMSCMNIGFSIEFCLKYLLEMNGITYKEDHNIFGLLCSLPDSYSSTDWYKVISPVSQHLSEWCVKSRYNDNFTTTSKIMEDVQKVAPLLLRDCRDGVKYESSLESRVAKILTQLNCKYSLDLVLSYLPNVKLDDSALFEAVKFAIRLISDN